MSTRFWSESRIAARRPKRLRVEPLESREVPATFTVTTFADVFDPTDGRLSFREAIGRANANPGADTIQLPTGVFAQTLTGTDDLNAVGDFDITDSLTVSGVGRTLTVIKGNRNDGLFDLLGPINVTFSNLTLRDGGDGFPLTGGAVHAPSANITLNNCLAIQNIAVRGGAIDAESGTVTVRNSRLSNNGATGEGGGAIFVGSGRLVLDRSTVSGNFGTQGGGVFARTATVTLSQSVVKLNAAETFGGGIDSEGGLVSLSNSSVRGNLAGSDGGGVFALGNVNLTGSSVIGNRSGDEGGGIQAGTANLFGSILAGNIAEDDGGGIRSTTAVLTNTTVSGNTSRSSGGGISVDETVSLNRSTVSGNTAGAGGGGVRAETATILSSTISGNNSASFGGGLQARAATLTNSTISGNTTPSEGGGISVGDTLTLVNCTVSGNTAGGDGGGISAETVNLTNVTVSGNMAGASHIPSEGEGGGVSAGHGTILNSTIVENRTVGFALSRGAGVASSSGLADLIRVQNTIIAQNFDAFGQEQDVSGSFLSLGNNLIGVIDFLSSGFGASGDLAGTFDDALDPQLAPLANNGGPTKTHALLAGSPAIDRGNNVGAPAADQRGLPRIKDGNGDRIAVVDIGAFER